MKDPLAIIRKRRAEIAQARKALDVEDADLEQAEQTIARVMKKDASQLPGYNVHALPKTQKDCVIAALLNSKNLWFDSLDALRQEIKEKYDYPIKATSFQPLISNMTTDKTVVRDGPKVALTARVNGQ